MADFCKQCSIEHFGSDLGDLAGLVPEGFITQVLCEGCGLSCIVNHHGMCVAEGCLKEHGKYGSDGDESARVEQWAANYLDCQSEPDSIQPNYDDVAKTYGSSHNLTPEEERYYEDALRRSMREVEPIKPNYDDVQ